MMMKKTMSYSSKHVRECTEDYFSNVYPYSSDVSLPTNVFMGKYAINNGKEYFEESPQDLTRRMTTNFVNGVQSAKIEHLFGCSPDNIYQEILHLFKDFKYVIPQGSVLSMLGNKQFYGSLSNCFVAGQPHDSYSGIMDKDQELAQFMKRRGGVGLDISSLRPKGAKVSNSAKTSTGAASFMERFSNTTREVAQEGRRGALMLSIDIRHPDVEEFITIKQDLTKVTGANVSVFLRDDFMEAVLNDSDYFLRFPVDAKFFGGSHEVFPYNQLVEFGNIQVKRVKAKDLWEKLVTCAHNTAEPGLMFKDAHDRYSPSHIFPGFENVTTNPCSEIAMGTHDSCRLIVLNFASFVEDPYSESANVDLDKFYKYAYKTQLLADTLVDLEIGAVDRIINKIKLDMSKTDNSLKHIYAKELSLWTNVKEIAEQGRRTGTGFTGLGDMLALLGLKYDSSEAFKVVDKMMNIKMKAELDAMIDLAKTRGAAPAFNIDLVTKNASIKGTFWNFIQNTYPDQWENIKRYGLRNISWSTVAPTGSVSILTATTSGIEPAFMLYYTRRVKVNPSNEDAKVDFVDQNGDKWTEYVVMHPQFENWYYNYFSDEPVKNFNDLTEEERQEVKELSPWHESTAPEIDWVKRVEMQSIVQKYTSHSISSTINLPNDVSVEKVSEIYQKAWEMDLKGITVYRDGCRSGVLVTQDKNEGSDKLVHHDAPKRPKTLPGHCYKIRSGYDMFLVIIGLFGENEDPYEAFVIPYDKEMDISGHSGTMHNCHIVKLDRGMYDLFIHDPTKEQYYNIENFTQYVEEDKEAITRVISSGLRHGIHTKYLVTQLEKGSNITSFTQALARVLKNYIQNGETISGVSCESCGSSNIVFEEGCHKCMDCGSSKCG